MTRQTTSMRLLAEVAALARIDEFAGPHEAGGKGAVAPPDQAAHRGERRPRMTDHTTTPTASGAPATLDADRQLKAATRAAWALGDYHRFALETVWGLGPVLVEACGISTGQRVLDVAAGTGNTAIRAAEAGAEVVASDLTPENFQSGRREVKAHRVELEWVEADAERLPFHDREFDVVTSSFGAMFAPNHQAVADELVRVCRPGGTIGMLNFTPQGLAADFFGVLAPYAPPPPPGALSPLRWGSEEHVRELFGERVASLEMTRNKYVERADSPSGYVEFVKATFGPVIGIYASRAGEPERAAALDRDFLEFASRANQGPPDGPAELHYEYLIVVARTPGA
jgi:ubiquinone/menaquinone biosynthesis C-methylase UbiE